MEIGEATPSGDLGEWRVMDILTNDAIQVYYDDGWSYNVQNEEDWKRLPDIGLTAIRRKSDTWMGSDEYRYHGENPKYGLMLRHHQWYSIKYRVYADAHEEADEEA